VTIERQLRMIGTRIRCGLVLALLSPIALQAVEVRRLDVSNQRRHYTVNAEVYLDASPEAILAVVADFDHLDRINETVVSSEYRGPAPEGGALVASEVRFCVAFICQDADQLHRVYYPTPEEIVSDPIPEYSDLPDLMQHWWVRAEGEGSVMEYTMSVSAEGFIPPLIGPALVRRTLRRISRDSADMIEQLAQARTAASQLEPAADDGTEGGSEDEAQP
jgi:Polyketide cyclase / dehydrase and lipid transport